VTEPSEPDPAAEEEQAPIQTGAVERAPAAATAPDEAEASEPVDLLSAAPQPEEPAAAATPGAEGWIVQVSSQRTREEAESSWNAMRERYASVLGSLQPSIQQANLGEKGIFHRVRVGPWPTRGEAVEVCEALKAAGGSCFVAQ
jgi:cell division septation protein DedD